MCFAPSDERHFFDDLKHGNFDAQAVCSAVDAMAATATVAEDREMITGRIKREVGLKKYNEQLRQVRGSQQMPKSRQISDLV